MGGVVRSCRGYYHLHRWLFIIEWSNRKGQHIKEISEKKQNFILIILRPVWNQRSGGEKKTFNVLTTQILLCVCATYNNLYHAQAHHVWWRELNRYNHLLGELVIWKPDWWSHLFLYSSPEQNLFFFGYLFTGVSWWLEVITIDLSGFTQDTTEIIYIS